VACCNSALAGALQGSISGTRRGHSRWKCCRNRPAATAIPGWAGAAAWPGSGSRGRRVLQQPGLRPANASPRGCPQPPLPRERCFGRSAESLGDGAAEVVTGSSQRCCGAKECLSPVLQRRQNLVTTLPAAVDADSHRREGWKPPVSSNTKVLLFHLQFCCCRVGAVP